MANELRMNVLEEISKIFIWIKLTVRKLHFFSKMKNYLTMLNCANDQIVFCFVYYGTLFKLVLK